MTLRGEVVHPGTYGIRPGEKFSSVIQRAGGFSPSAYPYGSVLTRLEVQQLEEKSYSDTIQRVRQQQTAVKLASAATSDPNERMSDDSAYVQWQSTLDSLSETPPTGRAQGSNLFGPAQLGKHQSRPHGSRRRPTSRFPSGPATYWCRGSLTIEPLWPIVRQECPLISYARRGADQSSQQAGNVCHSRRRECGRPPFHSVE